MGQDQQQLKILVTGGQGFVGGALVRALLAQGYANVAATARRDAPELEALGVEVVRADLTEELACRRAVEGREFIFHTAAKAGIWGSEQSYHDINVKATRFLLAAAREAGADFVHTSTPSVSFKGYSEIDKDESGGYSAEPLNAYCRTKIEAEREVLDQTEIRTLALRPHLIYGPGDPHLLPRLFEAASQKKLVRIGTGENLVDVTHIDDVVAAHLAALERRDRPEIWGKAYYITSGHPIRLWSWLAHLLNWKTLPPIRGSLSLPVAVRLGRTLERVFRALRREKEPPLTEFTALQLGHSHTYSIERARKLLGYSPRRDPYEPFEQQFTPSFQA